jgi:hypothetical protein
MGVVEASSAWFEGAPVKCDCYMFWQGRTHRLMTRILGRGRAGPGDGPGAAARPGRSGSPLPGPGQLRVLLLLGRLGSPITRRSGTRHCGPGPAAEIGGRAPPDRRRPSWPRALRDTPGFPPGSRCSAGGRHSPHALAAPIGPDHIRCRCRVSRQRTATLKFYEDRDIPLRRGRSLRACYQI